MLLLCRLEIIDWFHHVDNVHGVTDDIQDIVKGFVGHRSLVNGTFVYRCCIYACHLLLVFLEGKLFDCLGTGHDAACAVRGRVIPLGIAFAECQDASVTHVDGNENLFTLMCGDGSFSENHLIDIDVVVNGMKRFAGLKAGSFQQFFGNLLPVQSSKLLFIKINEILFL